jgi:hypothetical protein
MSLFFEEMHRRALRPRTVQFGYLVGRVGIEPTTKRLRVRYLTRLDDVFARKCMTVLERMIAPKHYVLAGFASEYKPKYKLRNPEAIARADARDVAWRAIVRPAVPHYYRVLNRKLGSPCDDCAYRRACQATAQTCAAFNGYIVGHRWKAAARVPSVTATRYAAMVVAKEIRRDAREEARALRKLKALERASARRIARGQALRPTHT